MVNRITDSVPIISTNGNMSSIVSHATDTQISSTGPDISPQQKEEEVLPLPADKAKKMTESINRFMETTNTSLRFQFHEELEEYYVTIVDSKTNELVKEVPSKKLMDIYASMKDFLGLMVDHKI